MIIDGVSDEFPVGLRVLVVDDDAVCLKFLGTALRKCQYKVTECLRAETALRLLRENKNGFDIVLSDVYMPDMDGFKLLEIVGLEMDLPVIMISADDSKEVVMKGVTHGACDYLVKPVRMHELKNIWQHVIRKTKREPKDKDCVLNGSIEDGERKPNIVVKDEGKEEVDNSTMENEGIWKKSKKRKEEDDEDEDEEHNETSSSKKHRIVWTRELHQQFLDAVNRIGYEKAVPKRILEAMNVPGITRENIASHLQKYRIFLRKNNNADSPMMVPPDVTFGSAPASFHAGTGFQTMPSNQFPSLNLGRASANNSTIPVMNVPRNNPFGVVNPVEHPAVGSLIQGFSTNNGMNQSASMNWSAPALLGNSMNVSHNPQLILPVTAQPVSRLNIGMNQSAMSSTVYPPPVIDLSRYDEPLLFGNAFPNARNTNGSGCYIPDFHQQYNATRGLPNVGSTMDASHHVLPTSMEVPPSTYVQPLQMIRQASGSSAQGIFPNREGGQNVNSNSVLPRNNPFAAHRASSVRFETTSYLQDSAANRASSVRFETSSYHQDSAANTFPTNNLYSQNSDDTLSALLKPIDDCGSVEDVFDELR